ncbi:GMC family oxidoreductase [Kouleothrix sp.]|uniref:GMC family oxidoreductase n=1 Tax=Kouleothrix sp. TaxID=2779161 RepID=UPI00391DC961
MSEYDVIIVGAGAGGGVAAGVLAEAGRRVLLLERGGHVTFANEPRDHLRHHRFTRYGHNTGPDLAGNPRVLVQPDGAAHVVPPHDDMYHSNAAAVGGGTAVYGAQSWRFLPADFAMASAYGVPPGSSLADWPIGYGELAPYYDRAEWEIGVAGESAASAAIWPRARGYPMPPLPVNREGALLRAGAAALGWPTLAVPVLINTAEYGGRPACIACQHCVGFACPVDAKNGTHNTLIPRALASGRCDLVTGAMVERIDTDSDGRVLGVSYYGADGRRHSPRAAAVVCAAGAIETARLLLNSRSPQHPAGLGNQHDQVGRNLQGHYYPAAFGLMPEPVYDGQGPGVSAATCRFNHGNPGLVGGGMLANEFIALPIIFWARYLPPDVPRWGAENKRFMRESYRRVIRITGPVQEIPSPDARVTLDPRVRDRWGIPVARLAGTTHPETLRTAAFMAERAHEWLRAAGATRTWGKPPRLQLSAGQHQAGTCRMGDDPRTSVVDRWGRVHGHDNLYVADGSVHVTNGGFNPVLTIMALAFRTAGAIAGS